MTAIYILQSLAVALSIGVVCICLYKHRQPRTIYFTCLAIFTALLAVGYLLEITAPTLEAAVVACKVQYLGIPFLGVFLFLFCREYTGHSIRHVGALLTLSIIPAASMLLVFTWPLQNWFYAALSFSQSGLVPHLVLTPGPFYYILFAYSIGIAIAGAVHVLRSLLRSRGQSRIHGVVFLLTILLLGGTQLVWMLVPAPGWDPLPLVLSFVVVMLCWYLMHYRQPEWQQLGRDAVVENMKDAFILMDEHGHFMDANATAYAYFPEMRGVQPGTPMENIDGLPPKLLQTKSGQDSEFTLNLDGDVLYLRASYTPLQVDGKALGTSILVFDNTENYHLMSELRQLATHDALTGLYNRGTFFNLASRDYALARRRRDAGSVLMMDIDHFKKVNDRYGHTAGDKVLVTVADILRARLRQTDIAGRYGGEELAVWLPGAELDGAAMIADVFRRALEHTIFESDDGTFHVTISIGVASVDHLTNQSFDELVSRADTALYRAKNGGRNLVCVDVVQDLADSQ